jgi:hypothetical protein
MRIIFKKKIQLLFLCSFLCVSAFAQEVIDDDMLENIAKNASPLWSDNTAAFANTTIPTKYKDESAVVFGYRRNVTIDKKFRAGFLSKGQSSLMFYENVHFKVKLNDKSAVQTFTEVYFRYSDKEDGFAAKLIKADGTNTSISLNDAVTVESKNKIPEFYQSFFDQESGGSSRYFKVAIPDLEAGDILEYVTITKSKLNVNNYGYIEFSPQYEVCSKGYPVLFNQIAIELDDKSYFKSMALNGAPEFKKEAAGSDDFYRYVFTDTDRPTEKDINFVSTYLTSPLNKFQVIYANKEKAADKRGALIGEKGELKKSFSINELTESAWETYAQVGKQNYIYTYTIDNFVEDMWKRLKKAGAKDWENNEYIEKSYYMIRSIVVNRDNYLSDRTFAYIFRSLLDKKSIKSDLVISISNNTGKVKDILFDEELKYATSINGKYYFNTTDYSNPNELVENMLNNEAYIITEPNKKNEYSFTKTTLPDADIKENNATYEITSTLNTDMNTLTVSRTSSYKGISKSKNITDALKFTTFMLDEYRYTGEESPTSKMTSREEEEYYKSVSGLKENFKEKKPEFIKNSLQSEYSNTVKYKNFSIASDGRSIKKQDLKFTEDFELSGMVRKAGKKYLVNLIGLVGSQLQIKKEERIRSNDINVGYARSLFWVINFKIPDGYVAEGLKEIATEITNETGTYAAVADEANGIISLKIKKIYKQANMEKTKWQDMLKFVDAAYNNSFKYILLKPKS